MKIKKVGSFEPSGPFVDSIKGFAHRKGFLGTEFFKLRFRLWKTKGKKGKRNKNIF